MNMEDPFAPKKPHDKPEKSYPHPDQEPDNKPDKVVPPPLEDPNKRDYIKKIYL